MLQERLKSVVYRSFVTCDDPKGVVDCGTIRRYKKGPQKMKHKVEAQQAPNEPDRSLQILEVSRGGDELNKKLGSRCSSRSEVAAKDLLRGALDLQESLVILGKLQEASKYMTQLKKQKEKNNVGGGLERHRVSVNGESRDCIEQLREAIRDGFTRQNLQLSRNARTEEKACLCGRSSEMPSTSSTQFSTDHPDSNRFGSPSARQRKAKGTNLIARLMGLEEICLKPVQAESKQITSQRKPLREREHEPQSSYGSVHDFPPIVLIKPMRAQWQEPEAQEPAFHEEGSSRLNLKKTPRKEGARESLARKPIGKEVCNDPKEVVREEKNEAIVKRVDKIQKMASAGTKLVKKETMTSQDQARVTKTKAGKPENGSNIRTLQMSEKQKAMTYLVSKSMKQPISSSKKNPTENGKKPREKPASQGNINNLANIKEKIYTASENENEFPEKETYSTPTNELTTEEESNALELHIEEDCTVNPKHETAEEDSKRSRPQTKLEAFLLSSPSFLSRVEELFDLKASFPLASQSSNTNNSNEELSLAYANEFVERRSLPDSRTLHPLLLTCTGNTAIRISPNHLMEEVCNAVETLERYSKLELGPDNSPVVDHLFAVSERDMLSDGVVTGTWDLGWRNAFSVNEAERVVNDLEKLLLFGLIEEAFA